MGARLNSLVHQYRHLLPFLALLVSSLFFQAAVQRIVFYICVPFFISSLWMYKDTVGALLKTKACTLIGVYLGYFTLSYFWGSEGSIEDFSRLIRNVIGIGLFTSTLAIVLVRTKEDPHFPMLLVYACLAYGAAAAAAFYGIERRPLDDRLEAWGRYINPIHLSLLFSFAVIIVTARWMHFRDKKMLSVIVALLLSTLILLTQTRTAFVGIAMCVVVIGFLGHIRLLLVLAGLAIVAAIGIHFAWPSLAETMIDRADSYRLIIWHEALTAFMEKPVFGHGIGDVPRFFSEADDFKAGWESPHNTLIGHAYHGGIIGLTVYLALVLYMFWIPARALLSARRTHAESCFLTVFTLLAVVYGFFASQFNFAHYIKNVHIQWLVFWVPLACVIALELREKERGHAPAH